MKLIIVVVFFVLLYLFLLCPRLTKQKSTQVFRDRFYVHRGLHDNKSNVPENSLPAFQKAVEHNYGIELDVQLTKDEVLVVFHDETLTRVCGQEGKVADYTYEELCRFQLLDSNEKIPTFEQMLEVVEGKVPLIIEIKMYAVNSRVCEVLANQVSSYKGVYCVESFNPLAVRWFKKNCPSTIRGQLSSALNIEGNQKDIKYFLIEHLLTNVLTRPDFIAYNHRFKNRIGRIICRKVFRCFSVTWTIKSQEELNNSREDFDIFIFEGFIPMEK